MTPRGNKFPLLIEQHIYGLAFVVIGWIRDRIYWLGVHFTQIAFVINEPR